GRAARRHPVPRPRPRGRAPVPGRCGAGGRADRRLGRPAAGSRPATGRCRVKSTLMDFDKALELFEPVLGFEVHVELNTKTKMFSAAPNSFGREPNTELAPVDLGLPGSMPVVNEQAV